MTSVATPDTGDMNPTMELVFDVAQIICIAMTADEPHTELEVAEEIVETAKRSRLFGGDGRDPRREFWSNIDSDD